MKAMLRRASAVQAAAARSMGRAAVGPNNARLQALAATLNGATAEPQLEASRRVQPIQRMLRQGFVYWPQHFRHFAPNLYGAHFNYMHYGSVSPYFQYLRPQLPFYFFPYLYGAYFNNMHYGPVPPFFRFSTSAFPLLSSSNSLVPHADPEFDSRGSQTASGTGAFRPTQALLAPQAQQTLSNQSGGTASARPSLPRLDLSAAKTHTPKSDPYATIFKRRGGHSSLAKRRALDDLIRYRNSLDPANGGPGRRGRNRNNRNERPGHAFRLSKKNLNIAHKLSYVSIGRSIAFALRSAIEQRGTHVDALAGLLKDLVQHVNPHRHPSMMKPKHFRESAVASFAEAQRLKAQINRLIRAKPGQIDRKTLILRAGDFCACVANSVMNLHLGGASANKAIGPGVDFNYTEDGLLTPRSHALFEMLVKRRNSPNHRFHGRSNGKGAYQSSGFDGYAVPK